MNSQLGNQVAASLSRTAAEFSNQDIVGFLPVVGFPGSRAGRNNDFGPPPGHGNRRPNNDFGPPPVHGDRRRNDYFGPPPGHGDRRPNNDFEYLFFMF